MSLMKTTMYGILLTLLVVAMPVSAATGMSATELRAEIARLTRVADSIRAQLTGLGNNPNTVQAGTTDPNQVVYNSVCMQTSLRMKRGDSGGSVKTLQYFLVQQGVYSADLVTGYFGPATEAGVQRWQAANGVVSYGTPATTGFGLVGPGTLRAMHAGCPGGVYAGASGSLTGPITTPQVVVPAGVSVEHYTLSLNPTKGLSPLNVTAEFSITGSTCTSYLLDWGDGSTPIRYDSGKSTGCASKKLRVVKSNIYNRPGTYNVSFKTGKAPISQIEVVNTLEVRASGVPVTY